MTKNKYERLSQFLAARKDSELILSFEELEKILGFPLPISARIHPAWWANQNPPSSQSGAWMSEGWSVSASLKTASVTFRRSSAVQPARPRTASKPISPSEPAAESLKPELLEDAAKEHLQRYLESHGWETTVRGGKIHGIDIEAFRPGARWIIEVKGSHLKNPVNVTYFLSVIGELLQRMNDPNAKYSVAFPDLPQFRGLWARLPGLAKQKTGISCLFVKTDGEVNETS